MGFGILFRLDESSLGSHLNERRVRGEEEELRDMEESGSVKEHDGSESDEEVISEVAYNVKELARLPIDHPQPKVDATYELNSAHILPDLKDISPFDNPVGEKPSMLNNIDNENSTDVAEENIPSNPSQLEALIDMALGLGSAKVSGKSYGLHAPQETLSEDCDYEEKKGTQREKPYISKAERRKLKKGQKSDSTIATGMHEREEDNEINASDVQPNKSVENLRPASGKITRGQKGKLKKIKEKYAEQDDEERKIRMALLASAGKALKNEKESQDKNGASTNGITTVTDQGDPLKICYKCKRPGHLSRDCQERLDEINHTKVVMHRETNDGTSEDLPDADANANAGNVASTTDRMTIEEDDIHEIGEEEKGKLNDVDYLTGNPLPNDILLYAVPVCAPYNALQTYKYRVKITPGTAKKGKAAKTAMNLFSHMPEATNREKELMKACTDPELVAAIIGNVKITAAGLTQLKQKQKKGKKTNKGHN